MQSRAPGSKLGGPIYRVLDVNTKNEMVIERALIFNGDEDRFDRTNNPHGGSDLEKNQISSSRNISVMGHVDGSSSSLLNENSPGLIALEGCCTSEAGQLLHSRWAAAMHCFNDPSVDLSERPVMYTGSSSAWGPFLLPHQLMASTIGAGSPGSPMDFLSELCRSKNISDTGFET